ncbi:hypothetical protein [Ottowia sp.]|uniref:hypothetical protein n=1 Tax=Ottowia sp. TaxID=1898956 RepID=UPI0025D7C4A6|nr:hypothetical protein [Ottowia sp.]
MAARLLAALLLALALVGGGYWWGHTAADNAWAARQAQTKQAAEDALDKETARADQANTRYLTDHLDQEDRYADLDAKYRDLAGRAPLVVYRRVPVAAACAGAAPALEHVSAAAPAPGAVAADGPVLTLAAVRMWNGALTGIDAPAGACGVAGAAEGADASCAEDSGLSLDDAWANHTINAKSCAADRQRYQALIDFLNHRETPTQP